MASSTAATSSMSQKRARRIWTLEEELTLVGGLMELCVDGWRGDNGTFRHGYLMELELYMIARLPNSGLHLSHISSKIREWKKNYATISLLKSQRGLGFQYSDGTILVDCPKAWDDLIKVLCWGWYLIFEALPLTVGRRILLNETSTQLVYLREVQVFILKEQYAKKVHLAASE